MLDLESVVVGVGEGGAGGPGVGIAGCVAGQDRDGLEVGGLALLEGDGYGLEEIQVSEMWIASVESRHTEPSPPPHLRVVGWPACTDVGSVVKAMRLWETWAREAATRDAQVKSDLNCILKEVVLFMDGIEIVEEEDWVIITILVGIWEYVWNEWQTILCMLLTLKSRMNVCGEEVEEIGEEEKRKRGRVKENRQMRG